MCYAELKIGTSAPLNQIIETMSQKPSPYYVRDGSLIIDRDILKVDKIVRLSLYNDDTVAIHMVDGKHILVKPYNAISLLLVKKDAVIDYMAELAGTIWHKKGEEKKEEKNPLEERVKALEVENKKLQETLDILEARLDSLQSSKATVQPSENLLDI